MARPLHDLRKVAHEAAGEYLRAQGFTTIQGHWIGQLQLGGDSVEILIDIPEDFPDHLPRIKVDPRKMDHRVFNCDREGVLCLAPPSAILLDSDNPAGIVEESLGRARSILESVAYAPNAESIADEFRSYWDAPETIYSICSDLTVSRTVSVLRCKRAGTGADRILVCDSNRDGELWLSRQGLQPGLPDSAFLCAVDQAILPPPFGRVWTVAEMKALVQQASKADQCAAFMRWVDQHGLPCSVVISIPTRAGDRVLTAAGIQDVSEKSKKLANRGYRPSKVTATRLLTFGGSENILPLGVDRFDRAFLVPRGGGSLDFQDKAVTVTGVGAVGSRIAEHLLAIGIGKLQLIDHDLLQNVNVHRHVLGVDRVGTNKALAIAELLSRRYPHLNVQASPRKVEDLIGTEEENLLNADLLIFATGEANLELRLNEYLGQKTPRRHVWVDPLDTGGHALLTGVSSPGCLACLYRPVDDMPLHNRASFVASGQDLTRTMGGCSDRFVPFSALIATRAAIEGIRLGIAALSGEKESALWSWFEGGEQLKAAGFELSKRSIRFSPGLRCVERQFADRACPVCSKWNV